MEELWRRGAMELAGLIRRGEVSSREVVEAHLCRIDEVNPWLNAVVRRLDQEALSAADSADRAVAAGDDVGLLHGVPFTVKEIIAVAGTPTTAGMRVLKDAIARRDDPAVERLRRAGAIPIGRTNLPDIAMRSQTDSSLHGLTRNPWNSANTAGGSSGGEAVALAAGMSPLGLANDFGGSIRVPAHCCGVVGIRPTIGLVPTTLSAGLAMISSQMMATNGVMARHVDDVAGGLSVLTGPHPRDPRTLPITLAARHAAPLRVALASAPDGMTVDPAIVAAVLAAGTALEAVGHSIVEGVDIPLTTTASLWARLAAPELASQRERLTNVLDPRVIDYIDLIIARQPDLDSTTWSGVFGERYRLQTEWAKVLDHVDVIVAPTINVTSMELDADIAPPTTAAAILDALGPTRAVSVVDLPAVTVPVAVAGDAPISVQLIANRFCDLVALECGRALEDAFGAFTPIDPVAP